MHLLKIIHLHRWHKHHTSVKMEQTECSEKLARKIQTLWNHWKERMQHSEHSESLKSRMWKSFNRPVKKLVQK